jgi:hypothetical protein
MKKIICSLLLISGLCITKTLPAQDNNYKTALGIRLSSSAPMVSNSITLKHFLNERTAIEALFSFGEPLALGALIEMHKPLGTSGIQWFYGGGGYLAFVKSYNAAKNKDETNTNFGGQGVIGLDYKFVNLPINLSLDWKPELNLIGDINFEPAAVGFTARFTFGK